MFNDQENTIISESENTTNNSSANIPDISSPKKAKWVFLGLALFILIVVLIMVAKLFLFKPETTGEIELSPIDKTGEANPTSSLPIFGAAVDSADSSSTINFAGIEIEYLSFEDFYEAPAPLSLTGNFEDYSLPLNVKMDVVNYYDLSRKLVFDPVIDSLNENGFALISNPWSKEAPDFYSVYANLESKQIPLLITADFITYHYQNVLKKAYKDIEENVFYNNLWFINKELYLAAKTRYESRLAEVGNINDAILEGARLQMAYFAVSLELLKPGANQVSTPAIADLTKFSLAEADKFYFTVPTYLREQVTREIELIKEAKVAAKSPNLLYVRDYKEFTVPDEYRRSARLNNLYLAMRWLNSVFPLNYQDKTCPTCLLDKEDWRLTTIAASFIAEDFSRSVELKNRWARIYKIMAFFNPTRDDLNYVFYRDAFRSVFGTEQTTAEVFSDNNPDALANLEKFRISLDKIEFPTFLGGISKDDDNLKHLRGFKILSLEYAPSEYILKNLTTPIIGAYQGEGARPDPNLTACSDASAVRRCNGLMLDFVNLVYPIENHHYFTANSSYAGYQEKSSELRRKLEDEVAWRANNYWSTLSYVDKYLNVSNSSLPIFAQSAAWQTRVINTGAAALVNTQLSLEKLSSRQLSSTSGLTSLVSFSDYSYVEPNFDLVAELAANVSMMEKMLVALEIDKENPPVLIPIRELSADLIFLKEIITKELSGKVLSEDDNMMLVNFAKRMMVDKFETASRQLTVKLPNSKNELKEDISRLKLLVLIRQENGGKIISVGPVWDYQETR